MTVVTARRSNIVREDESMTEMNGAASVNEQPASFEQHTAALINQERQMLMEATRAFAAQAVDLRQQANNFASQLMQAHNRIAELEAQLAAFTNREVESDKAHASPLKPKRAHA